MHGGESSDGLDHDVLDLSGKTGPSELHVLGAERGVHIDASGKVYFDEVEEIRLGSGGDFVNTHNGYGPLVVDGGEGDDTLQLQGERLALADVPFDDSYSGIFVPDDGSASIAFGPSEGVTLSQLMGTQKGQFQVHGAEMSGQIGNVTFSNFETVKFHVICFVRGTRIKTLAGEVAVEELARGDRVLTLDNGYQPIRWIGSTKRAAQGHLAPVRIKAGVLGNGCDLLVSPQHRLLLRGLQAEMMFGEEEVLVPAKSLLNDQTVLRQEGGEVEYFHILFDRHEIIFAEGALAESFHPGLEGWKALEAETRAEILELFPHLAEDVAGFGPSARLSLREFEGKALARAIFA